MVNITTESPVWGGSPRAATNQYIQDAIDSNPAGTTYYLQSGVHYGQIIEPKSGDTIVFMQGASLIGGENISGSWIASGTYPGLYYKDGITRGLTSVQGSGECRVGYDCGQLNCIVVDGELKAWRTSIVAVGEHDAYYDSGNSRVYLYGNPNSKTVIINRTVHGIVGTANNVTVKADNSAGGGGDYPATFHAEMGCYASDAQSEYGAFVGGRDSGGQPSGTGWLWQDLWMHSCSGFGYAPSHESTTRRCLITGHGQMGHGSSKADDCVFEYCSSGDSGLGGWEAGWEGGNNKFSYTERAVFTGNLFYYQTTNPNVFAYSVLWLDIENDGAHIYDNICIDTVDHTRRGLFWEISESAKIRRNIFYGLARNAENNGWAKACFSSESGPVTGSIYPTIEMYENHAYACGGGFGAVEADPREYTVQHLDIHNNITYYDGGLAWTEQAGVTDWSSSTTPTDCNWDYNVYYLASGSNDHWSDEQSGGGGSDLNWSQWQSAGQDANGVLVTERTHPSGDPDPFNGGCMVGF